MNEAITLMKLQLAEELEKQGSSLEQFEAYLAKEAGANPLAVAGGLASGAAGLLASGVVNGLPALGGASMMVGSAGGAGAYATNKYMRDQDKRLDGQTEEAIYMKKMIHRLKSEHGLK